MSEELDFSDQKTLLGDNPVGTEEVVLEKKYPKNFLFEFEPGSAEDLELICRHRSVSKKSAINQMIKHTASLIRNGGDPDAGFLKSLEIAAEAKVVLTKIVQFQSNRKDV